MKRLCFSLLPLMLLVSCGTNEQPSEPSVTTPERLRIGTRKEPKSLNPYLINTPADEAMIGRLFPRLFMEEAVFKDNMPVLTPVLVANYAWDETGKVLTLNLKKDLQWSDGKPLTTEDVAYSLTIQRDKDVAWYLSDVETAPTRWDVVDAHTITLTYAVQSPFNLLILNEGKIIPKHHFGSVPVARWREHDWTQNLVVFGPYEVRVYDPAQRMVLAPLIPDSAPTLGFAFISDKERLYQLLLNKELDLAWPLPVERVPDIRNNLTPHVFPDLSYTFMGWNPLQPDAFGEGNKSLDELHENAAHPLFSDARIRRALTLAMNRKEYNQRIWGGEVAIPATPWRAGLPYYNDERKPLSFDREAAGKLLDEAGWPLVDGKRMKNGKAFSFTAICNAGSEYRKLYLLAIQEDMRSIGVDMTIDLQEPGLYFQNMISRNFDAIFGKLTTGTHPTLNNIFHSTSPYNLVSWRGVDQYLEAMKTASHPTGVQALIADAETAFQKELPMSLLYVGKEIMAASDDRLQVLSNFNDALYQVNRWQRK